MAKRRKNGGTIETKVLSDALRDAIGARKVQTAVFLTFRFDPGFFEQEVLPVLFDESLSHVPKIRLLNLEHTLRTVDDVAIYYDRRGLEAGSQSAQLDTRRIPVSRSTGFFHPKNVLLLVEKTEDGEGTTKNGSGAAAPARSLILGTLSANLTRAGWWENVEVAHFEEVAEREECSFRDDLLDLIRRVKRDARQQTEHQGLDAIRSFVLGLSQARQRPSQPLQTRLYRGGERLVDFLKAHTRRQLEGCRLEIISPYFDEQESAGPVEELVDAFDPVETKIALPRGIAGEALCGPVYYERIRELGLVWSSLPDEVMKQSPGAPPRRLHAKVYRFFDPRGRYEALFIGSANLTNAAFTGESNFETGFLLEPEVKRRPDWWLQPDEQEEEVFLPESELDEEDVGRGRNLSVRYDWNRGAASVYWDASSGSPELKLSANGVDLFTIAPLPSREWSPLDDDQAAKLEAVLQSTSFLRVEIEGESPATILVEEEEMTQKPSLMARLTVTEILRYWSLLSSEQRKQFLEARAFDVDDAEAIRWLASKTKSQETETFFDKFAGIYHSFGNLERAVFDALEEGREKEAVGRLFGRSFDSLAHLVGKVIAEEEGDAVNRYVMLLCAMQLLKRLKKEQREFCRSRRGNVVALENDLKRVRKLRSSLTLGKASESRAFIDWFERQFLDRVGA
ncbi:MAG: hypothetical protein KY459_11910 [Acidobacteria bacterium]|nr:hypothetical protein [Acidobacteriota bacterium]